MGSEETVSCDQADGRKITRERGTREAGAQSPRMPFLLRLPPPFHDCSFRPLTSTGSRAFIFEGSHQNARLVNFSFVRENPRKTGREEPLRAQDPSGMCQKLLRTSSRPSSCKGRMASFILLALQNRVVNFDLIFLFIGGKTRIIRLCPNIGPLSHGITCGP